MVCPQGGPPPTAVPHPKGLEGVFDLDDLLDVVGDGGDDLVNEVHHTVGGVVVSFQQPSTVHGHNLSREEVRMSSSPTRGMGSKPRQGKPQGSRWVPRLWR